jgi:transposase
MKLAPQSATFSVDADRPKVLHVLNELYASKVERFFERGDLIFFRIALLFRASSTAACECCSLLARQLLSPCLSSVGPHR